MTTKTRGLFSGWLVLVLVLVLSQQLAAQQETQRHYRIELIVVRHLAGSSDTAPQETLRNFSDILDLHAPPVEPSAEAASAKTTQTEASAIDSLLPEDELSEEPPLVVRIDDMSDTMRETWRRLRGSAGFRPELFRAWEQSGDSPFPQLRIHDDEVLFTIDPAAQPQTLDVPVDEYGALVFSDATIQRKDEPSLESQLSNEPEPIEVFYRIDGSAALSRTRFLHLNLDIELREPLFELTAAEPAEDFEQGSELANQASEPLKTGPAATAPVFRIHRIEQRRQVRTEQMEYFDGPVIGVLALVTGFDVVAEIPQPESLQP